MPGASIRRRTGRRKPWDSQQVPFSDTIGADFRRKAGERQRPSRMATGSWERIRQGAPLRWSPVLGRSTAQPVREGVRVKDPWKTH